MPGTFNVDIESDQLNNASSTVHVQHLHKQLVMTNDQRPLALITAATVLSALSSAACGPGGTDQNSALVSDLKIKIPESATDINADTSALQSNLHFLLPNDQWRPYAATYYPGETPTQRPLAELTDSAPPPCFPSQRNDAALITRTISDIIQFRNTNMHARRVITIIPDCQPGRTYVQWSLSRPS